MASSLVRCSAVRFGVLPLQSPGSLFAPLPRGALPPSCRSFPIVGPPGVGEVGIFPVGVAQFPGAGKICVPEIRASELCAVKVRVGEVCAGEGRVVEVRIAEMCVFEVGGDETRAVKMCLVKICRIEARAGEVCLIIDVCACKVRAGENRVSEVCFGQVCFGQVRAG